MLLTVIGILIVLVIAITAVSYRGQEGGRLQEDLQGYTRILDE